MNKEIRFGLVGYGTPHGAFISGRGGGMFRLAVQHVPGVTPAAICDSNPVSLDCARKEYPDIPLFEDFDAMLDRAQLDALFIGTPATCHAEFAIKALERKVHVLSEIPTVADIDEANGLWAAHQASPALYMAAANPNYWAFVETAVDLKRKGLLGDPYHMDAEYLHDLRGDYFERTPWRATYEPIRYCTHSLGPMLRLIDEDLEWVSCFDTGSHINREPGQHDAMTAIFRTPSNVVLRLTVSFINNYPSGGHHYRIFTTKGAFERTFGQDTETPARTLLASRELYGCASWSRLPVDLLRPEQAAHAKASGHGGADYALLADFFRAIREGGPSPIGLREGLRMTLPGLFAARSARQGGVLTRIAYPWKQGDKHVEA